MFYCGSIHPYGISEIRTVMVGEMVQGVTESIHIPNECLDVKEAFEHAEQEVGFKIPGKWRKAILDYHGSDLADPELEPDDLAELIISMVQHHLVIANAEIKDGYRRRCEYDIERGPYMNCLERQLMLIEFVTDHIDFSLQNLADRDFKTNQVPHWKDLWSEWNATHPERQFKTPESMRVRYSEYIHKEHIREAFFQRVQEYTINKMIERVKSDPLFENMRKIITKPEILEEIGRMIVIGMIETMRAKRQRQEERSKKRRSKAKEEKS